MEREAFAQLCALEKQGALQGLETGVGTLAERGVHRVVKRWLEPREAFREVRVGRHIADIRNETGIFEVQTRDFSKLKNKLDAFLPLAPLTVVYPVAAVKWVRWLDTQTGELTDPRRSPKKGMCADVLHELVYIKDYFHHENLRFMVPLIEVEEVRLLNGWGAAGKRGAHRAASYPIALLDVQHIAGAKAFKNLLPPGLTRPFTAAQLAKAMQRGPHFGTRAANALRAMGSIQQVGKAPGGAYLYE